MFFPAEVLLAEALLVRVLPFGVFLVAENEMVPAVSELLEKKEKIPPGLEILEEEKALMSSDALLVLWCSWSLSSSLDWTGGHQQSHL